MKFETQLEYFDGKITVETDDFDIIKLFQEFIEFQEKHEWCVSYKAVFDDNEKELPILL